MKKIIITSIVIACSFLNKAIAQANNTLSNLAAPTAINTGLLPGTTNSIHLGSAAKTWKNIYFKGGLFYGNLKAISFDTSNTAVGLNALAVNTTGVYNIAIGKGALASNTEGYYNTASGTYALYSNTTGYNNTANSKNALYSNTTGANNTASGYYSLYSNTKGNNNTANGNYTLYSNTTGSDNTANGNNSLSSNTTGYSNTANGNNALKSNTSGYYNTANGTFSMFFNTTGNYNTANGYNTLYKNSGGGYNAAYGSFALYSNTTGNENSAGGDYALYANTTGIDNTANGVLSLSLNTTGNYNTGIGHFALRNNTTGSSNTAIGVSADVAAGNLSNATAIGNGAIVNASNKVVIGNTYVTEIGGWAQWSKFSDGRFKSNIKQNVPGLAFINKLKPVTYTLELKKFDKFLGKKDSLINSLQNVYSINEKKIHTGFIAQEIEKAAKELNYDFDGVNTPKNDKDNYSIAYADFVPSLVKAVQELSKMNDSLTTKNQQLEERIARLEAMMNVQSTSNNGLQKATLSAAALQQNIPNPFNQTTTINYTLPQKFSQAYIIITDKNGKTVKQVNATGISKGTITIDTASLPSGVYHYSLIADGKQVAAKQMIKIK